MYSTLRAADLLCVSELGHGHATSFVVSFVLALNRRHVFAVTTLLVLRGDKIKHHILGWPFTKELDCSAVFTSRVLLTAIVSNGNTMVKHWPDRDQEGSFK